MPPSSAALERNINGEGCRKNQVSKANQVEMLRGVLPIMSGEENQVSKANQGKMLRGVIPIISGILRTQSTNTETTKKHAHLMGSCLLSKHCPFPKELF